MTAENSKAFEQQIRGLFSSLFSDHAYLMKSVVLQDPEDQAFFRAVQKQRSSLESLAGSLRWLLERLSQHFQKACILLIDEEVKQWLKKLPLQAF